MDFLKKLAGGDSRTDGGAPKGHGAASLASRRPQYDSEPLKFLPAACIELMKAVKITPEEGIEDFEVLLIILSIEFKRDPMVHDILRDLMTKGWTRMRSGSGSGRVKGTAEARPKLVRRNSIASIMSEVEEEPVSKLEVERIKAEWLRKMRGEQTEEERIREEWKRKMRGEEPAAPAAKVAPLVLPAAGETPSGAPAPSVSPRGPMIKAESPALKAPAAPPSLLALPGSSLGSLGEGQTSGPESPKDDSSNSKSKADNKEKSEKKEKKEKKDKAGKKDKAEKKEDKKEDKKEEKREEKKEEKKDERVARGVSPGRLAASAVARPPSKSPMRSHSPLPQREKGLKQPDPSPMRPPVPPTVPRSPAMEQLFALLKHDDPSKYYGERSRIGKGGFGDVYIATDLKVKKSRPVAIKVMREKITAENGGDLIANEILLLAHCRHKNIVNFVDAFLYRDRISTVMEYCDGGSLVTLYKAVQLKESHISYIMRETLCGLSYLHSENRMHRDIKGDNILLNLNGEVKIADLGLAAEMGSGEETKKAMVGSRYWMAPEMIKRETYNTKADIWSLGCVLVEICNTTPPYYELRSTKALFKIATKGAAPLRHPEAWSKELRAFLAQMVQFRPDQRPTAAEALKLPWLQTCGTQKQFAEVAEAVFLDNSLRMNGL